MLRSFVRSRWSWLARVRLVVVCAASSSSTAVGLQLRRELTISAIRKPRRILPSGQGQLRRRWPSGVQAYQFRVLHFAVLVVRVPSAWLTVLEHGSPAAIPSARSLSSFLSSAAVKRLSKIGLSSVPVTTVTAGLTSVDSSMHLALTQIFSSGVWTWLK